MNISKNFANKFLYTMKKLHIHYIQHVPSACFEHFLCHRYIWYIYIYIYICICIYIYIYIFAYLFSVRNTINLSRHV